MSSKVKDYLILVGGSGLIVALDQWTKYLVRTNLALSETWSPFEWLAPYARIVHWTNTGAAFGIFPSGSLIFTVVAVLVSVAIIYYFPRIPSEQRLLRLALVMQLGGALGNLTSRLVEGRVTDFISVGSFAVFNVADSSISIGTAVLIAGMWLEERRAARMRAAGSSDGDSATELAEAE